MKLSAGSCTGLTAALIIWALLRYPGEPNGEPTSTGTGRRQATSSDFAVAGADVRRHWATSGDVGKVPPKPWISLAGCPFRAGKSGRLLPADADDCLIAEVVSKPDAGSRFTGRSVLLRARGLDFSSCALGSCGQWPPRPWRRPGAHQDAGRRGDHRAGVDGLTI